MVERFNGEWRTYKFDEVFKLFTNNTLSRDKLSTRGKIGNIHYGDVLIKYGILLTDADDIPRIKSEYEDKAKTLLRVNDVIVADTAEDLTVGKAVQVGNVSFPLAGGLHTIICRPLIPTATGYLGYYMNSKIFHDQLLPYITGIKVSSITRASIRKTKITLPPMDEQIAIAETLSAFDRHLANLSELIAKHEGIRAGALEDLLSGRTRLPGFRGEWRTVKLLDKVKLLQGLTYKSEEVDVFGTLVLRSSNVQNNRLSLNDNVYVRTKIRSEKMIQKGDILVCVRNGSAKLIGKSCVLPEMPNTTFGAFMSVLRGDTTGFIAKVFESSIVQRQLRGRTSATIHQITKKDFEGVIIPLPPVDEQIAIAETLSALDLNISNLKAEHAKISALRTAAINDLLTGTTRLERRH